MFCEFRKLRRCPIVWISLLAFGLGPVFIAIFFWLAHEPEITRKLGLFGQKAMIALNSRADWPGYFDMIEEVLAIAGLLVLSVIMTFIFGREYAEGTAKNLLSLPVARPVIVAGKLVVGFIWFGLYAVLVWFFALFLGGQLGLGGWSRALVNGAAVKAGLTILLTLCLGPLVALIAMASRGYFAPLGYTMASVVFGMLFGTTNWSPWCPWSIIPLWAGLIGPDAPPAGWPSMLIMGATMTASVWGCMAWLSRADNNQ